MYPVQCNAKRQMSFLCQEASCVVGLRHAEKDDVDPGCMPCGSRDLHTALCLPCPRASCRRKDTTWVGGAPTTLTLANLIANREKSDLLASLGI